MKKLFGILTFHNANNYGAALQAYALQRFLRDIYGDGLVDVIDYKCAGVRKQDSLRDYVARQGVIRGTVRYSLAHSRIKKIAAFCRENMSLSKQISTRKELPDIAADYEVIISGSDQVWNRKWTGGEDTYLQDFHNDNRKKVSYAASFGLAQLPSEWVDDYRRLLGDFSHISVREEPGKNIVRSLLNRESDVHLDPTLLHTRANWNAVAEKSKSKHSRKFVLAYMVPYQKSVHAKAKELAKRNGLDLLVVCKSLRNLFRKNAAVDEVVSMFRDAEYVVTNSFHGTAFSIIYQKKFIIELDNKWGYNIRSAQLIKKFNISDLSGNPKFLECFNVDWENVEAVIESERVRTRRFFESAIEQV